jgi:hypothetical protein
MFKELFTESVRDKNNVYWDKDKSRWGIENDIRRFGERYGDLIGVFVTAENARSGKFPERWCFSIDKEDHSKFPNPGKDYIICRYVSHTTLAGGMAPAIAINPKAGKIKYLNDYDSNADYDYAKWERPLKVQYMRVVK